MATATVVRVLATNDSYTFDAESDSVLATATKDEAQKVFKNTLRSGGSALARTTADAPFKRVTEFPADATEVVLLPAVAGG